MKPQEQRERFIILRAEGKSYASIANELKISKSTCSEWERELSGKIAELKDANLRELYSRYYMTKEARIKKLGEALENIDEALSKVDLSTIPAEKLLDFKLKYTEALKDEYITTAPAYKLPQGAKPTDFLEALGDLLNRVRAGEVTEQQASRESVIIANLLKAYDSVELQSKITALEAILDARGN